MAVTVGAPTWSYGLSQLGAGPGWSLGESIIFGGGAMAAYSVEVKQINGTPEDAAAEAETYIETLDSTTGAILSINTVGGNDFITIFITHLQ